MRFGFAVLVLVLAGLVGRSTSAQEVVAQQTCRGDAAGTVLQGVLVTEYWVTAQSYRYYGQFQDPHGNVYELEVFSADLSGGTGSTWVNGMRHRETYLEMRVFQSGFVVQTEDEVVVAFACSRAG